MQIVLISNWSHSFHAVKQLDLCISLLKSQFKIYTLQNVKFIIETKYYGPFFLVGFGLAKYKQISKIRDGTGMNRR